MTKTHVNKISGISDKVLVYSIEKDFSVNTIDTIKKELDEIIQKNPIFTLHVKNIESFDLSAVQLLIVLENSMKNNLTIVYDLREEIKAIIKHSGFDLFEE